MLTPVRSIINLTACRTAITEFVSSEIRADVIANNSLNYISNSIHTNYSSVALNLSTIMVLLSLSVVIGFNKKNNTLMSVMQSDNKLNKVYLYQKNRKIIRMIVLTTVFFLMKDVPTCS